MAYYVPIIRTGRIGTVLVSFPHGTVSCRIEITSCHVDVHTRTLAGQLTSPSPPTIIQCMDDGGLAPSIGDFDFVSGTYQGTNGFTLGMPLWYAPQPAVHPMPMIRYLQHENSVISDAQTRAAHDPAVPHQQPPTAPSIGTSVNLPIVVDDNNGASARLPIIVESNDDGAQDHIPASEEATAEPLPPSHLRETLVHLKKYVFGKAHQRDWLESFKTGSCRQREEYCRLFWPSIEQAEVDLDWVSKHFGNFTEAYIERLAVEGRKRKEELDWEKEGEDIATSWEQRRKEQSDQAKRDKELRDKATKRQVELKEQRRIRLEKKEKRDAAKRTADEAKKKKAEEEKATKAAERERQRLAAATEEQRVRNEENVRKAEERKARRAAAPSRKRKAATAPAEPAKKRKTDALPPTPPTSQCEETPSVDELKASIMAEFDTEVDDDNDGLCAAIMAGHESEPLAESEESDADDDEIAAVFATQAAEPASESPARASLPQEQHTAPPTPPAQTPEPEEEGESEDGANSLFDGSDDETREDENESEEEEVVKAARKVLSPREIKLTEVEAEVEHAKEQTKVSRNKFFKRRVHERIDRLRKEREQYLQLGFQSRFIASTLDNCLT
ncbi:hypothetical protein DPSP01_000833 [Paraphaeosphaeria sporulosa]